MSKSGWMIGAAVAALAIGPAAAHAQLATPVMLTETATQYGSKVKLLAAAREHVVASRKLGANDPEAARELSRAGHLYYLAGHASDALRTLEQSGELAMQRGDLVFAANVLLQASSVAAQAQQTERARRLAQRAELLSGSPLLSSTQRLAILDQITRR